MRSLSSVMEYLRKRLQFLQLLVVLTSICKGCAADGTGSSWCVAMNNIPDNTLQPALDYACGLGGADCSAIQPGGSCFQPDTVYSHASYAFNSYYQKNGMVGGTCDFQGAAAVTTTNPSYGSCVYPSGSGSGSSSSGGGTSLMNGTVAGSPGSSSDVPDTAGADSTMENIQLMKLLAIFSATLMAIC